MNEQILTKIHVLRFFLSNVERLEDLEEILADDEIDEEMRKGMRDEFDEMQTAYPDIFPNNPPPRKYIIEFFVFFMENIIPDLFR